MAKPSKSTLGAALRYVRKAQGLTQEDFRSRVYVSALERGVKQPTLSTVDELAQNLRVHPLTLLALSYCHKFSDQEIAKLCDRVVLEAASIQASSRQKRSS